jgi:hypothetical protein
MRRMNEQRRHCGHRSREIQVSALSEVDAGIHRCSSVVMESERPPMNGFEIAQALKIGKPEVPPFPGHDFPSRVMNTRAVCG